MVDETSPIVTNIIPSSQYFWPTNYITFMGMLSPR